jgi:hypothetical protein
MIYDWQLTRYVMIRPSKRGGDQMELLFTAIAIIAGMSFSLAVALLVEELIFGKVFRVFFAHRALQAEALLSANARRGR